jgi:dipeptidyl aminopeptidase/acylaminoacyl peptidase
MQSEIIPRSVLFGNPEKMRARISPDGEKLAYIAPVNDVLNVWVRTVGEDDDRAVTSDEHRGIYRYFWDHDSNHIMFLQDTDGDENWRLYSVDLDSGEPVDFTPFDGIQVRIVDHSKHHPNTMLISMNKQDPRLHDVYRLDLETGDMEIVARNPGNIVGWMTDFDLKVRGAIAATPDGGSELLIRETEDGSWQSLIQWGMEDNYTSGPLGFTKDGNSVYLIDSRNVNAGRLIKYEIATGEYEVIAEDEAYDVEDVMMNPDTFEIEAVSFMRERVEWTPLNDAVAADFEAIAKLDTGEWGVYSRDDADNTWLVAFIKDNGPVSYYSTLALMEPVSFTSRDGLTIHGYATYPPGAGRTGLPMVLNVHGGPWARDQWGYNPEAQWLANRGYVCLQVNFRGSTGYGKDFLNAGDKEWGGKMQDDLTDAVNWAIDQGIADPERVAIYGASYGGYAALAGATFTPDLYCCAVPMMGPSNLITFIETIPPYWAPMIQSMYKRVGNPETEADFLMSRSPLFKVDEIKIPMLVAQGANDPRVKQAESEQIVHAMEEKGLEVNYILFEDEGHGFARPENRLRFYSEAEAFLANHLGGRSETAVEEVPEEVQE